METSTLPPGAIADRLTRLEASPSYRSGRARVRRELAEDLVEQGWIAAADEQEKIAASIERGER